jgi:hypothetical protein
MSPILISDEEAIELDRFTRNDYISVKTYPALMKLLNRVAARVKELQGAAAHHG